MECPSSVTALIQESVFTKSHRISPIPEAPVSPDPGGAGPGTGPVATGGTASPGLSPQALCQLRSDQQGRGAYSSSITVGGAGPRPLLLGLLGKLGAPSREAPAEAGTWEALRQPGQLDWDFMSFTCFVKGLES